VTASSVEQKIQKKINCHFKEAYELLKTIPPVKDNASVLIAEMGVDMEMFPTEMLPSVVNIILDCSSVHHIFSYIVKPFKHFIETNRKKRVFETVVVNRLCCQLILYINMLQYYFIYFENLARKFH